MPLLKLPATYVPTYAGAVSALAAGNMAKARDNAAKIVQECPEFDGGWLLLSQLAQKEGNISLAVRTATQAINRNPNNPLHYVQLGRCLASVGKLDDARKVADKALALNPNTAEDLDSVAMLMMNCGAYEEALPLQEDAVRKKPDNLEYRTTLAVIRQSLGNLDGAADDYRHVLGMAPEHQGALAGLARLETASDGQNVVEDIQQQLKHSASFPKEREIRLRYALAKQLEDLGDYAGSFQELTHAASKHRTTLQYDVSDDQNLVNTLIELFPTAPSPVDNASNSDSPIFVVGMPRSGTTLVERIISSHPDVASAGELHDFGLACLDICGREKPGRYLDADFAKSLGKNMSAEVGERYLERTARFQTQNKHFVDKLPMNILFAGFITRILPNAKIIELKRHPIDVCLSNYKILFRNGYEYSYDLTELADFYIAYRKLVDHWGQVLGSNYVQVHYEKLVTNQDEESRNLIARLGLNWSDQCLRFYENKSASATASSAQIRQPIYTKAVGRWHHYRDELSPLIDRLDAAGIPLNL